MFFRIIQLIKKELIQTLRDKRAFGILLIAPMLQLLVFGYVATTDIKRSAAVICDYDQTPASRALIRKFTASSYFEDKFYTSSQADIDRYLDSGKAVIGIIIPPDFHKTLKSGRPVTVGFALDGANSNRATILSGYIQFIIADYSNRVISEFIGNSAIDANVPLDVKPRVWFNPDLKSVNYMVPGVIGMLTLILLLTLTSLSIVRERELGTAEQIVVTPIRPIELVIGKIIPAGFAGFLVTTLVLVVGLLWFKINFVGSVLLLYFFAGFFMFCAISMGLLISTYSQTGDQAMWSNQFFMMPNVLLSGFIFPIDNMPEVIQYVTYVLPMRYFLVIIRGIFLQGAGFTELWPQAAVLFSWGLVVVTIASYRLKKH
ncbi:MAG: ABC transporter permease, partial [candidate division Zixibacteria bacterium]|nr:ABC transporter permease [candidate division Zixibacteria bacterium]